MALLFEEDVPLTTPQKRNFLLKHNIAVWDVVYSCDITGSSDSSIKNVVANDICSILLHSKVKTIFVNGLTAFNLYMKYLYPVTQITPVVLPSTSPANARYTMEMLVDAWRVIAEQ